MSHSTDLPIIVLKFGGSVLTREHDLANAVHEVYRWNREGFRVVAVVSALGKTTDKLLAQGHHYASTPEPGALASLVATGEATSAALLGLALDRAGIPAEVLDAPRINLRTRGVVLDSEPVFVNADVIRRTLRDRAAVVVPGFVGLDDEGRTTLLGRGGSDFTALFLAQQLSAARCRLVKDVKGLYERDPARPGPLARRFRHVSWDDALKLDGRIIQHKGVRFAKAHEFSFEVAELNGRECTVVGAGPTVFGPVDQPPPPPLRVVLLGLGTVGLGVYRHLIRRPDLFEVVRIAVRNAKRHANEDIPSYLLTSDPELAVRTPADVVIEAIGGVAPAGDLIAAALGNRRHVITPNKAVIAERGTELQQLATDSGVKLLYGAAVGGASPIIETLATLTSDPVESIDAVLNGTTNFVISRVEAGIEFEDAVREAQTLGFAEADPSRDLDATDSLDKIRILARLATGRDATIGEQRGVLGGITTQVRSAVAINHHLRLVASLRNNTVSVAPIVVNASTPLGSLAAEENAAILRTRSGREIIVRGKGAGRWPTSEAVLGDLLQLARDFAYAPARPRESVAAREEVLA